MQSLPTKDITVGCMNPQVKQEGSNPNPTVEVLPAIYHKVRISYRNQMLQDAVKDYLRMQLIKNSNNASIKQNSIAVDIELISL